MPHTDRARRWKRLAVLAIGAFCFVHASPGASAMQNRGAAQDVEDETIVVEGELIQANEFRGVPGVNTNTTTQLAGNSEMFAECLDTLDNDLVAQIVDGNPNEANTRFALDRLIRTRRGCYINFPKTMPEPPVPELGDCNNADVGSGLNYKPAIAADPGQGGYDFIGIRMCRNIFDRGALFAAALDAFAPDYEPTRERLFDTAVQRRFIARETRRNRFRYGEDKRTALIIACLVQHEPRLAHQLIHSELGSLTGGAYQVLMARRGSACLGSATELRADPSVFRAYVAEAMYRWALADLNRETLFPTGRARSD